MQDILDKLKIRDENGGTSTGVEWMKSKGKTIPSFSPVDGKKIANVVVADEHSYEQVMAVSRFRIRKASALAFST